MLFSLKNMNKKAKTTNGEISDKSNSKVYPIDLAKSNYKKAI